MYRPIFLLAGLPQFFGALGHAYLGERDIFPKLAVAKTGLQPEQLRILRVTWHVASLTFTLLGAVLLVLAGKPTELSSAETWIARGVALWYWFTGIACLLFWDRRKPQPWVFVTTSFLVLSGLRLTP
jgi:hypothetical protein